MSDEQLQCDYLNAVKWIEVVILLMPLIEDELQALRIVQLALNTERQLATKLTGTVKPRIIEALGDIATYLVRKVTREGYIKST